MAFDELSKLMVINRDFKRVRNFDY